MDKVHCANCGGWEYDLALEIGRGSGYWLELRGTPQAIGFGPPKHFCSITCVAEYTADESPILRNFAALYGDS